MASYLLTRQLARLVKNEFEAMADVSTFWSGSPEFARMRREEPDINADRFTLTNVLGRIAEHRKPQLWMRWYEQIARGKMTFAEFIKKIIITRRRK